jgi:ribosome-binding factor A
VGKFREQRAKGPSQRQLQVGEEIRHALSHIFMRGELAIPTIDEASVTVSEVRVSPDLKNATAFVMPLAGKNKEEVLRLLNLEAPTLRHLVSKTVRLRFAPKINFKQDESFDNAHRIGELLNQAKAGQKLGSE